MVSVVIYQIVVLDTLYPNMKYTYTCPEAEFMNVLDVSGHNLYVYFLML
jgi:hypothetical protein